MSFGYEVNTLNANWKPISIELNDGFDEFKDLVSIDELTDYSLNCDSNKSNKRKRHDCDSNAKKTHKKKKKTKTKQILKNEDIFEDKELNDCDVDVDVDVDGGNDDDNGLNDYVIDKTNHLKLWKALKVPKTVINALKEQNFTRPTPIQSLAIKAAIDHRKDLICAAETGSGKTLAFGIPLIHFIINDKRVNSNDKRLRALILTPTRELTIQVKNHIEVVAKYSDVTISAIVGGMSIEKQERVLKKIRPDIVVATPGRLWELIENNRCEHLSADHISNINYLVIDEADRMTEKGHFTELKHIVDAIRSNDSVRNRQFYVFSATLTLNYELPKRLKWLKQKNSKKLKEKKNKQKLTTIIDMLGISLDNAEVIDLTRKGVGTPSDQLLTETKINCFAEEKDLYLYYFISLFPGRTLIFCNSKDCLRRLLNIFKFLNTNPLSLHASMPQKKRLSNLEKFTKKGNAILIASDVAARGLDIANIDHVVHYQIPRTAEIYVHRSGRTARAFNKGLSLMLCDPKEDALYYKKLCQTLNKGNELSLFPIDHSLLKKFKKRIDLAKNCDQLEHRLRKQKSNDNWFRNAAKQCDIYMDDNDSSDSNTNVTELNESRQLKSEIKHLNLMLKQPLPLAKNFQIYDNFAKS